MADEIADLIRDLGKIPQDLKRELRPGLREAGREVLDQARRNAFWSTRIPGATRLSVQFAGRTPGVSVVTNVRKAPHGPINEYGGNHPVFGNRQVWVHQSPRPFQSPALQAKSDAAEKAIGDALDPVPRRAGFR